MNIKVFSIPQKGPAARAVAICLVALSFFLSAGIEGAPMHARVLKVLPQFVDKRGRHTISPSLYERDAYQFYLRKHPNDRAGLRLAVQWKAEQSEGHDLMLRAELRGVTGNVLHSKTIDTPIQKKGWFSTWSEARLTGDDFKEFGELVSWRVTILDANQPIARQESFLWSGVTPRHP